SGTPSLTARSTATASAAPTIWPTFTATSTAVRVVAQTPTPTTHPAPPQDHLWLARPLGSDQTNEPSRFYPYGTTGGGKYRVHRGSDFPSPFGTPVFAAVAGRVIVAGNDQRVMHGERVNFYGQLVIIQLEKLCRGQKVYVLYGHLSKVLVSFLEEVQEGDLIGEVGMTGVAVGPHLHLEVRVGKNSYEQTRNPELWLKPLPDKGTLAGLLLDREGEPLPEHILTLYRSNVPDQRWQDATTYPPNEVNRDEEWQENFAMGDMPAGRYVLKTSVEGRLYTQEFEIRAGETTSLVIQTGEAASP
ncbi:MAG: M23 family metallopeptidase, partial [Anaerolineae bacterium]|nr:M23 family metallopeptidase [Anaerolineae bacterium]